MNCLLFVPLLFTLAASAQVTHRVADADTKLPVPFATVKVMHSNRGQVADVDGRFTLAAEGADTLRITCIGYGSLTVPAKGLDTLIFLQPRAVRMDSLVLRRQQPVRHFELSDARPAKYIPWGPAGDAAEFAQRFDLASDSSSFRIDTVFIPVRKPHCQAEFLLHIYALDSATGKPSTEMYRQHLVIGPHMVRNGWFAADLTPARVILNDLRGFFVSVSWPPAAGPDPCFALLLLSTEVPPGRTFSRTLTRLDYDWFAFGATPDPQHRQLAAGACFSVVMNELR